MTAATTQLASPTLDNARQFLLSQRNTAGHWEGRLATSALSTATAVCALESYARAMGGRHPLGERLARLCTGGRAWLAAHQNGDGGWGDTTQSFSNISTTALCWAAFAGTEQHDRSTVDRCQDWLTRTAGSLEPRELAGAIRQRYGRDHTFSVPILTTLALFGRLGASAKAWQLVPQLPFELAACPPSWFAALRLPVVSYALPALIAIGLVRHRHRPTLNPLMRFARQATTRRALDRLQAIQPASGGYLEAIPLTSFLVLSLVRAGEAHSPVVDRGVRFLIGSAREDGSWAIDSNLATWVTTLAVRALFAGPGDRNGELAAELDPVRTWLADQQYRQAHPYTNAAPGGWAWTDLAGGVPDADDTPGAMLALRYLDGDSPATAEAAAAGARWLVDLQNRDGGIPTFCRGWGKLPFDRSSSDLTAHALRAWRAWYDRLSPSLQQRVDRARGRALRFLLREQRADGAWAPLWFGNQHAASETNLAYGTSRVLMALVDELGTETPDVEHAVTRGAQWLLAAQGDDGGWGGEAGCPPSIEETALATEALATLAQALPGTQQHAELAERVDLAIVLGADYLAGATRLGTEFAPSPIGFYFAKLWYFDALYPVVFTVQALAQVAAYESRR